MRHGNWEPFLEAELAGSRLLADRAARDARAAELALMRRLAPGASHEGITADDLRADRDLRDAREAFREEHRLAMMLRDECAGIEVDLERMADRAAHW